MRYLIDIVNKMFTEGEVVSLAKHKEGRVVSDYSDAVAAIFASEAAFFAAGKFAPFAKTYIDSGFNLKMTPAIMLDVSFRDRKTTLDSKDTVKRLRVSQFEIEPPSGMQGGFARKEIDLADARRVFEQREKSPYGAYQTSRLGFGQSYKEVYDDKGIGFHIMVCGYYERRAVIEHAAHIIDTDEDMAEVVHMFALINRARLALVAKD